MANLARLLEGVAAQINPFDNGATFATVQRAPTPAPTPAPAPPQRSLPSRIFDQLNPFDNGRTFKGATPTNDYSLAHMITHNGVTNTAGSFLNNLTGVPSAIDAGRLAV